METKAFEIFEEEVFVSNVTEELHWRVQQREFNVHGSQIVVGEREMGEEVQTIDVAGLKFQEGKTTKWSSHKAWKWMASAVQEE